MKELQPKRGVQKLKTCLAGVQTLYTKIHSIEPLKYESGGDFSCGKCNLRILLPPTIAETSEQALVQHRQKGKDAFKQLGECRKEHGQEKIHSPVA